MGLPESLEKQVAGRDQDEQDNHNEDRGAHPPLTPVGVLTFFARASPITNTP